MEEKIKQLASESSIAAVAGRPTTARQSKSKPETNRSPLSKISMIKWLKTRFDNSNRRNSKYLFLPEELIRENSMEQVFKEFDADGSGGLSRDEVFDMFNGFGIAITMQHLNQLYDSVEVDLEELDCQMFKKCALSEKSNRVFRDIVAEIAAGSGDSACYLPHNFTNMIIYLVYRSKREELRKHINQHTSIRKKVTGIGRLLRLKDLTLNNERLNIHADEYKQVLRNKFRDLWEQVNEKYRQKYPYTPKIEEEFFQYFRNKHSPDTCPDPVLTD